MFQGVISYRKYADDPLITAFSTVDTARVTAVIATANAPSGLNE